MSDCTFTIYTTEPIMPGSLYHFHCELPDVITYSDGRTLNRLNLWSTTYVGDAGKSSENINMTGFTVTKNNINYFDYIADQGYEIELHNFTNTDIDGTWVIESFSYTRDVPGGYTYNLSLERVR